MALLNKKNLVLRILLLTIAICTVVPIFTVFAVSEQVRSSIKDELTEAKIPHAAIAMLQGNEVEYLFHSTTKANQSLDENSLFQLGSVSKAYTGLGILLLEDEGLLSLDDPISKYLPWFVVSFEGKNVPPKDLTISNLLYQTSGFTNDERRYPSATNGMSLEDSVLSVTGNELMFYPSQKFAYSNTNCRILGLLIEVISGQRYEAFMKEHIFSPLGLSNTLADVSKIEESSSVIEGSRLSFFQTWTYAIPVTQGNVPAGYIYSNAKDMSRWLQIQMGKVEVSEQFKRIINKSHQPNAGSVVDNQTRYAAGWYVDGETGEIYHSGGTPNYSSNVTIHPESGSAVCILTNINLSANTNNIAKNTLNLLKEQHTISYVTDIWTIFDFIFSLVTIIGFLGTLIYHIGMFYTIRQIREGKRLKSGFSRNCLLSLIPAFIFALILVSVAVVIPLVFASSWAVLLIWAPFSVIAGLVLLIALTISAFIFYYLRAAYRKG